MRATLRAPGRTSRRGRLRAAMGAVVCAATAVTGAGLAAAPARAAPVGAGFTVTPADLAYILEQIKIAEVHAQTRTPDDPCGTLLARPGDSVPDAFQVPDPLTAYGLRTVDGSCNNLEPGRERFGSATRVFPRLAATDFRAAEKATFDPDGPGPQTAGSDTSYDQRTGGVFDSEPRLISNLVVDQTVSNPAAVSAAAYPVRTQGNPGIYPCTGLPEIQVLDGTAAAPFTLSVAVSATDTRTTAVLPVEATAQQVGTALNAALAAGTDTDLRVTAKGGPLAGAVTLTFTKVGNQAPIVPGDNGVVTTTTVEGVAANTKDCAAPGATLFIPNVTTDVGLSPPYNSLFTIFGQFFDHGLDKVTNGGNGTVFVPLRADDPLVVGPDGVANTADDPKQGDPDFVPEDQRFMVLTRATWKDAGPDKVLGTADDRHEAENTDSPWVDLSQAYTSNPSHQVFVREYAADAAGKPRPTGRLLDSTLAGVSANPTDPAKWDHTLPDWARVKDQAAKLLGLRLVDADVNDIPMLAVDPYGNFDLGPNGLPQYVTRTGLVEGDLASPVPAPANVLRIGIAFLNDIARAAAPTTSRGVPLPADPDSVAGGPLDTPTCAPGVSACYDDELLGLHFIAGDGRANENIALSAVHNVFDHEHNRLVADIKDVLQKDTSESGAAALAEWKDATTTDGWNGSRLFQAARFVTEMEYQHLVFEEFARKLVPAIRPFHVYHSDIDPAITAEFAHAVYRFGHSMLDDDIPRLNENGSRNDLPLLTGFLNPARYTDGGPAGTLDAEQAIGSLAMGLSDQVGNELDEFIAQTLRNNLLGLPLDLGTLNLVRARSEGIPRLNEVRRQINAATNDSSMAPYTDWSQFGQHLKHPESLVNFVAAYGRHPSILAESTVAGRRTAARAIVDPRAPVYAADGTVVTAGDTPPADAADFMFGAGTWKDRNTGVDDVDLWVGGLAERSNLFGALLGNTFTYVFQAQLEALQEGDRFYYLGRTPGMNLRTQLEGNTFSEIIMRNSTAHTLKQDAFGTSDCKFQLANLAGTPQGFQTFGATVKDDPGSECREDLLLVRSSDGTIAYKARNSVDPTGINGQSVYNGSANDDRITGGVDTDTVLGNGGDDTIEGFDGDDRLVGGDGRDVITDSNGIDVIKGGPGNDAIDGGPLDDILMGGDGSDVLNGGTFDNETFAGPGNDFVVAGVGADVVFGDAGDDWIQGGSGQDLLQGDHGAPFFDDPGQTKPGNDVFVGQVGENDYDAEGGDDLMAQNAAIDRNAGAGGFDWAFHQYDTVGADDDMEINNNLGPLPVQVVVNRDRWGEVEADSGSGFDDVLRGTTRAPKTLAGAGFAGCNALDPAGVARIDGLDRLVTSFPTDLPPLVAASAAGFCPLKGEGAAVVGQGGVWAEGNILLGGGGSDVVEGRADDDIVDGDNALRVRLSVRTDPGKPETELGWTDLLEGRNKKPNGSFGPGTGSMTLQQAVFKRLVDPGDIVVVREIVDPAGNALGTTPNHGTPSDCGAAAPTNCDVALFSHPPTSYRITANADGSTTVTDLTAAGGGGGGGGGGGAARLSDGTDTVWNVEVLRFCTANDATTGRCVATVDQTAPTPPTPPTAPQITGVEVAPGQATVAFLPGDGAPFTGFEVDALAAGALVRTVTVPGASPTALVDGLTNGTEYTFVVRAVNLGGTSPDSAPSDPVTPVDVPGSPTIGTASLASPTSVTVSWTPPADTGGSAVTGYQVEAVVAGIPVLSQPTGTQTSTEVLGLDPGTTYTFQVRASNAIGDSLPSAESNPVTTPAAATAPEAATIGTAARGNASATVRWTAPASDGNSPITRYDVQVRRAGTTTVVGALRTAGPSATSLVVTGLTNGTAYDFRVRAVNAIGLGAWSARSNAVTPATVPGRPGIGSASSGATGGTVSATARWTAPTTTGGSAVTGYRVYAMRMSSTATNAAVLQTVASSVRPASARSFSMALPVKGFYRFQVVAINAVGTSARSNRSNVVVGQ